MGFIDALTIVFIVLKLVGVINWSWWLVISPQLFALALYMIAILKENSYWRENNDKS